MKKEGNYSILKQKIIYNILFNGKILKKILAIATVIILFVNPIGVQAAITIDSNISAEIYGNDYYYWSFPMYTYLVNCENDNLMRVQSKNGKICVEYYDNDYNILDYKEIGQELPLFGGFYKGSDAYYIVTGQNNLKKSADVECFKLSKYDKNWNKIASTGLSDCNTTVPFDAGSLRMAEADGYLVIRTSHEMYNGHQANVTIQVDETTMKITDSFTDVANVSVGYVSHSFNQFIKIENNHIIAVDHCDAYPRSIVLTKYVSDFNSGYFFHGTSNGCTVSNLLKIRGPIGYNETGVSIGGFEITKDAYIVAASSWDMESKDYIQNICILSKSKIDGKISTNWITSYCQGHGLAMTPQLVKINDSRCLLMWYDEDKIFYTYIDSTGKQICEIYSMDGELSECQPIVHDNKIVWIANHSTDIQNVIFYTIDIYATMLTHNSIQELIDVNSGYSLKRLKDSDISVLMGVKDNTKLSYFLSQLEDVSDIVCTDMNDEELVDTAIIYTGCKLKLMNNSSVIDTVSIIVKGDVDGNGAIDVLDMEAIQKSILGIGDGLSGVYKEAALLSGYSEEVSVLDMEAIQKDILGIDKIN